MFKKLALKLISGSPLSDLLRNRNIEQDLNEMAHEELKDLFSKAAEELKKRKANK
jgi:hypothetical protein